MRKLLAVLSGILCFILTSDAQNIVLTKDSGLIISDSTCMVISVGTTLTFTRGADCDPNVLISDPLSLTSLVNTSDSIFTHTFTEVGTFVAFCDANPGGIAVSAVCITVEPQFIPVLSEWGFIVSVILFLILVVTSFSIKSAPFHKRLKC